MEKKDVASWIKFGLENEVNKKKAIKAACFIISALNSDKKITDEDIKNISGGDQLPCFSATFGP